MIIIFNKYVFSKHLNKNEMLIVRHLLVFAFLEAVVVGPENIIILKLKFDFTVTKIFSERVC